MAFGDNSNHFAKRFKVSMTTKSAFNWNDGTPSIFSKDDSLRRHIAGKKSAATQQKNQGIGKKKPILVYALAKAAKK